MRFLPTAGDERFKDQFPGLKWFELQAATKPKHPVMVGAKSVKIGIDPADGLARVLVGTQVFESPDKANTRDITTTVRCDSVSLDDVRDSDLLLPAEAAEAKWVKVLPDNKTEPVPAPKEFIAKK